MNGYSRVGTLLCSEEQKGLWCFVRVSQRNATTRDEDEKRVDA